MRRTYRQGKKEMSLQPPGRHYLHAQWTKSRKEGCGLNQNRDTTSKTYLWSLCTADCPALPVCLIATYLQEYLVVPLLLLNLPAFSFSLISQFICCSPLLPKANTNCCLFGYPSLCPFIAALYLFVKNVSPCLTRITLENSISCITIRS